MHALAPREQREEAEELRLRDQRHVQVLRNHVDAEWEHGDAPEEPVQDIFIFDWWRRHKRTVGCCRRRRRVV